MRIDEVTKKTIIVYHGNQGGIHQEFITPMWWTESYEDAKYYATQNNNDGWIYKAKLTCKNYLPSIYYGKAQATAIINGRDFISPWTVSEHLVPIDCGT